MRNKTPNFIREMKSIHAVSTPLMPELYPPALQYTEASSSRHGTSEHIAYNQLKSTL